MKFFALAFALLLVSNTCGAQPYPDAKLKVAVIDTGLNLKDPRFRDVLCPSDHLDFTGEGIEDYNGHGTHVAGLIKKYAKDAKYCLVILKYFPGKRGSIAPLTDIILYAQKIHADFINISAGGNGFVEQEMNTILSANDITFIVAAGNDSHNLDESCNYFPACYLLNNVTVVGALGLDGKRFSLSNYGSVVRGWEPGEQILSTLPEGEGVLSGSSMATAIHTGKMVYAKKTR